MGSIAQVLPQAGTVCGWPILNGDNDSNLRDAVQTLLQELSSNAVSLMLRIHQYVLDVHDRYNVAQDSGNAGEATSPTSALFHRSDRLRAGANASIDARTRERATR